MKDQLSAMECCEFTEALMSKSPVPGGGGTAALIGSLAAALGTMAANLTLGKQKYISHEKEHLYIIAETDRLRVRFLELMDEDADAFEPLSKIYSMDKGSPGYTAQFQAAALRACKAPYEMMECCCQLISLLEQLIGICSALLLSDVGCAALASRCALEAAAMNVFVNTRTIPDSPEAAELSTRARSILYEYGPRSQSLADSVMNNLIV